MIPRFVTSLIIAEIIIQLPSQDRAWIYSSMGWIGVTLCRMVYVRYTSAQIHLCVHLQGELSNQEMRSSKVLLSISWFVGTRDPSREEGKLDASKYSLHPKFD